MMENFIRYIAIFINMFVLGILIMVKPPAHPTLTDVLSFAIMTTWSLSLVIDIIKGN